MTAASAAPQHPNYMHSPCLYDLFDCGSEELTNQERFFLSFAAQKKSVLDIGAGSGSVALHLAEHGISVTCLEPSPGMYGLLVSRLVYRPDLQARVTPLTYNALDFKLATLFPLISASNLFHLMPDTVERDQVLVNIRNHLEVTGTVIIDFRVGDLRPAEREPSGKVSLGEVEYRRFTTIAQQDANRWLFTWSFEIFHAAELVDTLSEKFVVRTDTPDSCRMLVREHGLQIVAEYSDYGFTPFEPGRNSKQLIIVAQLSG